MSAWVCVLFAIIFPNCSPSLCDIWPPLIQVQPDALDGFRKYHSQVNWTIYSPQLQHTSVNSDRFNAFSTIWQMTVYPLYSTKYNEITEIYSVNLCLIWMPLEWEEIHVFYSIKLEFLGSIWRFGYWFVRETYHTTSNQICTETELTKKDTDYSFSSNDISLNSFTITLSLILSDINTNNIPWEYHSLTWDEYTDNSHSYLIFIPENSIDITNWNDYPLIDEYAKRNTFNINASIIREGWNTGKQVTLSSEFFWVDNSIWQTKIYVNNESRVFYMEVCVSIALTEWNEITFLYTMKYCQLNWTHISNITLQMNDEIDDDILCFGQLLDGYWLEIIDLLLFNTLKFELYIHIIQITNKYGQISYKKLWTLDEYERDQMTKYRKLDTNCFGEVMNSTILCTQLRKYEDETTVSHILSQYDNLSLNKSDWVSDNELLNAKSFFVTERDYYKHAKFTISMKYDDYSNVFQIKGSNWELYARKNKYDAIYIIEICVIKMPLQWNEIHVFCMISLCQFDAQFIQETSFVKVDKHTCFEFVNEDLLNVIKMMQFTDIKLSVSIKITRIIDEYGFTIYKNYITLQQYETLEMTKSNEWNKYCFQSSRYYLSPDYVLLDINEVSTSQLLYDSRSFCENIVESIEQISFSILIVLLIDIIKPYWIQQIVKMKKRKSSECAWVRCNRTKAEFKLYWCKRCHGQSTYYCGSNHQKKHWKYVHFMHCGYMRICW